MRTPSSPSALLGNFDRAKPDSSGFHHISVGFVNKMLRPGAWLQLLSTATALAAASVGGSNLKERPLLLTADDWSILKGYDGDITLAELSGQVYVDELTELTNRLRVFVQMSIGERNQNVAVHIHKGKNCSDAGPHYYKPSMTEDPWSQPLESGPLRTNTRGRLEGQFEVGTGFTIGQQVGHTVVIHVGGKKVACSILDTLACSQVRPRYCPASKVEGKAATRSCVSKACQKLPLDQHCIFESRDAKCATRPPATTVPPATTRASLLATCGSNATATNATATNATASNSTDDAGDSFGPAPSWLNCSAACFRAYTDARARASKAKDVGVVGRECGFASTTHTTGGPTSGTAATSAVSGGATTAAAATTTSGGGSGRRCMDDRTCGPNAKCVKPGSRKVGNCQDGAGAHTMTTTTRPTRPPQQRCKSDADCVGRVAGQDGMCVAGAKNGPGLCRPARPSGTTQPYGPTTGPAGGNGTGTGGDAGAPPLPSGGSVTGAPNSGSNSTDQDDDLQPEPAAEEMSIGVIVGAALGGIAFISIIILVIIRRKKKKSMSVYLTANFSDSERSWRTLSPEDDEDALLGGL